MDKIDRLLDAIEHPDRYPEKDLEAMLADPEVRETYTLLQKTRSGLGPIATPDVDAEWNAFKRARTKRRFPLARLLSRNAAASIAIGLTSLAAVAAVVGVGINYAIDKKSENRAVQTALAQTAALPADTIVLAGETAAPAPETVTFDNETLETIVRNIAKYYGYTAEFSSDAPKSLRLHFRWDQSQTLGQVVESLNNFEQIHITVNGNAIVID